MEKINSLLKLGAIFSFLLLNSQAITAQIEEIVVTAQKRAKSIQDIGLTITAVSSERALEALGKYFGFCPAEEVVARQKTISCINIRQSFFAGCWQLN